MSEKQTIQQIKNKFLERDNRALHELEMQVCNNDFDAIAARLEFMSGRLADLASCFVAVCNILEETAQK